VDVSAVKTLDILGEKVEVFVDGEMSDGNTVVLVETSPPGGGPPPHMHTREDETFCVLEGSYEFFENGTWRPILVGLPVFGRRNAVHGFRNAGTTVGRILVVASPSGLEKFFDKLTGLSPARDMPRIVEVFAEFGLSLQA
jgi:quercetin dioxygenase-like cupin family protein